MNGVIYTIKDGYCSWIYVHQKQCMLLIVSWFLLFHECFSLLLIIITHQCYVVLSMVYKLKIEINPIYGAVCHRVLLYEGTCPGLLTCLIRVSSFFPCDLDLISVVSKCLVGAGWMGSKCLNYDLRQVLNHQSSVSSAQTNQPLVGPSGEHYTTT